MAPANAFASHRFVAICGGLVLSATACAQQSQSDSRYKIHDMARPQPSVVAPGTPSTQANVGTSPADAIVLFDGTDLSKWSDGSGDARWRLVDGVIESVPGGGYLTTREAFGDCQLHLEWMVPADLKPKGGAGANSGVYLMQQYEVQILRREDRPTYPDGMAGAIYGQHPPLAAPDLPKGEWNTFDILFTAPRFDEDGSLKTPAYCTVIFNGVVVQNHVEIFGRTAAGQPPTYAKHPDRMPISIQDHGDRVRFRNIWIRPMGE
ncbi:MAG: 3-keto-disaccharide hydrolase [Phycisphaerales bacterium]